jgi:hypothetical protein
MSISRMRAVSSQLPLKVRALLMSRNETRWFVIGNLQEEERVDFKRSWNLGGQ